ncbi:MAG TPA: alpha/beta fold hydrolase [Thermomicrobiaceae bacterium]|nr:alpha/beta fold hydrolase [Thermomicrobiaceae bacterium]
MPPALAPRVPNWLADGIDATLLREALAGLPAGQGPASPDWVRHFSAIGDDHARRAAQLEAGDQAAAMTAYLTAAFFYFLARFPHFLGPDPAAARDAYAKHRAAYLAASRFFPTPVQVVRLPFEEATIVGYLRIPTPTAMDAPPVVVLSGGIDYWKSDSELHTIADTLLGEGLAVFALDMPGTGESPLPNGPHAERVYEAAIAHLGQRPDVDGGRLGVYGLSFGGHWAVKLALTHPQVRAAVNVSGPIHHAFTEDWCAAIAPGTLATLAATFGQGLANLGGPPGMARLLAPLSLVAQQVLGPRADLPALLSIAGGQDESVPPADLAVIGEAGVAQDTVVYAGDRHVASHHRALHLPLAARWLRANLSS